MQRSRRVPCGVGGTRGTWRDPLLLQQGCRRFVTVGETEAQSLGATGLSQGHGKSSGQSSDSSAGVSVVPRDAAPTCPLLGCFSAPGGAGLAAQTPAVLPVATGPPSPLLRPRGSPTEPFPAFDANPLASLIISRALLNARGSAEEHLGNL